MNELSRLKYSGYWVIRAGKLLREWFGVESNETAVAKLNELRHSDSVLCELIAHAMSEAATHTMKLSEKLDK